jgi:hypothetical protein
MASKWQEDLEQAWLYRSAIILCGNIRDLYPYGSDDANSVELLELDELIARWAAREARSMQVYDPVEKFRWAIPEPPSPASAETNSVRPQPIHGADDLGTTAPDTSAPVGANASLKNDVTRISTYLSEGEGRCCVVNFAERVAAQKAGDDERTEALVQLQKLVSDMPSGNRLVLIYLFADDIPRALYVHEPRAAVIEIPGPERRDIKLVLERAYGLEGTAASRALNTCYGLSLREISRIAEHLGSLDDIDALERAVRTYKFGVARNYWDELSLRQLQGVKEALGASLKGQAEAIDKVATVLVRAKSDIQNTTGGNPSRPRGVLFFAGPTGVGKTMMAQKLAEFVFGDPSAYLRFDMSEYQEEFQVNRLYGAPPGYVGFEQGGQLTSPLQANPFRVLLFDEFEKANARVFDIFLQILGDGRLTDSKGGVAHFSESIIIFTSNLGADRESVDAIEPIKGDPVAVRAHFRSAVETFFRTKIGRPELLNRIGRDNIVVFNFIDNLDVAKEILSDNLVRIRDEFNKAYAVRTPKISLELQIDEVTDLLIAEDEEQIRAMGGREVENLVNDRVRDWLALLVLEAEISGRPVATIRGVADQGRFRLELVHG